MGYGPLIKVKRFQIAAEKYIDLSGGKPTDKRLISHLARRIKAKWSAIRQLRRDSGYTNDEIAEEILDSLEEYLYFET
ncbi:hypothetical protein M1O47_02335 [Dehalococcoidia bacterium]|nr:hypothetical protein [Dehalococcoidia bacterium]